MDNVFLPYLLFLNHKLTLSMCIIQIITLCQIYFHMFIQTSIINRGYNNYCNFIHIVLICYLILYSSSLNLLF